MLPGGMRARRGPDLRTLALFGAHTLLPVANLSLVVTGMVPPLVSFVVGLVASNLSFTIWHECVHNTVSTSRRVNTALGFVTSVLMVYPGYFSQRRDHLLHHKYQGDPEKDPVYPRVQGSLWGFPYRLVRAALSGGDHAGDEFAPTSRESATERAGYALCAVAGVALIATGNAVPLFAAFLLPRGVMIFVHAFYVCYLPHHEDGPRLYQTYRIVLRNPLTRYLTLYHSYHGLHHLWPTIPWHQYRRTFLQRREELAARGCEILS